jgi:hypothetical protein
MMSNRGIRPRPVPMLLAFAGVLIVAVFVVGAGVVRAHARATSAAAGDPPSNVPYAFPVQLPASKSGSTGMIVGEVTRTFGRVGV